MQVLLPCSILALMLVPISSFLVSSNSRFRCRRVNPSVHNMGFLDDLLTSRQTPKVSAPKDFVAPEPQPLTLTESSDLGQILKSSASLVVRLATGVFVLGWKIDTLLAPNDGKYALALGPFRIRDSSSVLQDAPRPQKPLIYLRIHGFPILQAESVRQSTCLT
jgi:hypothetical protein